ncbi:MAG: hypothetical protein AAFZ80_10330 [Cyanobacteria bacterium P01_A01_bin.105]
MTKAPAPFANNWAYIKVELNWLERLLMLAVARKRKDLKTVDRVARNRGDKVTSHWWQGLIHLPSRAYDEGPPPQKKLPTDKPLGYQKQLDLRIRASHAQRICLALPQLRSQLNLSLFEKNALLMALAPEVNLRYSRLYHFLQTGEENQLGALPAVDLMLQLLCRNEAERRLALAQLGHPQSLIQRHVLQQVTPTPHTLLGSYLQLTPNWARYLLADHPSSPPPLAGAALSQPLKLQLTPVPQVDWSGLVLGEGQLRSLQALAQQAPDQQTLDQQQAPDQQAPDQQQVPDQQTLDQQASAPQPLTHAQQSAGLPSSTAQPGLMALFIGETSTGKTTAAGAISVELDRQIMAVDLAQYAPNQWPPLLEQLTPQRYPCLLIRSAQHWLGRHPALEPALLQHWWQQRAAACTVTLFTTHYSHTVATRWRQRVDGIVDFPQPDVPQRQRRWQQALPQGLRAARAHHWQRLAQIPLTGDQIQHIAKTVLSLDAKPTLTQLQQVLGQHGHNTPIKKTDRRS